ncbi:PP2C family protein-serine/threonine phosphatase [Rhodobacter amnigenus]|nr:fused response regulator/phosphatase [Rhodobacter amnigenus]
MLATQPRRVLVTDDSAAQRRMLALHLTRWGYQVSEAATGQQAIALARSTDFDIILSDWMMPGMTGPEFCRAYRALPRDGYGYFVLLSARSEKTEIADGLDSGADDFLTKPVDSTELLARLHAGERILQMQAELRRRHRDLERLYAEVQRDLAEAHELQASLLPDPVQRFGPVEALFHVRTSGHLGGDMVGWFPLGPDRIAVYAVDVAGHGVAAALMAARLAALLSHSGRDQNVAFRDGHPLSPAEVVSRLNRLLCAEVRGDQYVTMVYADLSLADGTLRMVQAGHPHPLLLRRAGRDRRLGRGGFPVGLVPQADYAETRIHLRPGDRLVIPSDGITECPGPRGDLGDAGLLRLMRGLADRTGPALRDGVIASLTGHAGTTDFPDDVSFVILDRT